MAAIKLLKSRKSVGAVGLMVAAVVLTMYVAPEGAVATHKPADKVAATGNKALFFQTASSPGVPVSSAEQTLLTATMRTSSPSDLILSVGTECFIATSQRQSMDASTNAFGAVQVWVEIDGVPVGVNNLGTSTTSSQPQDDGRINFCQGFDQVARIDGDDDDVTSEVRTRSNSNSFSWVALNVGNGIHNIVVKGRLTAQAFATPPDDTAAATAAVLRRVLVVQPAKLANDANV